ncbi:MAG TPA: glycosyltransferase, partial [Longimicrobiaceae bacterium]|nr:glycosyltransferase [Longimicrobiaceae bacterium]
MMRVVQVGCVLDAARRDPEALLDAWPTLPTVAGAVAGAGAEVTVLQAANADASLSRDGVRYRFVAESRLARIPGTRSGAGVLPVRLARAAAALRPDLVHLNGLGFPLHARALSAIGAPVLVQDHADALPPRPRIGVHRWGFARVAGFAFTAREQAEPFAEAGIMAPGARLFEIPESTTRFTPGEVRRARAATGIYGDPAL